MAAEIGADLQRLFGRDDEIVALDIADDAEPLKTHQDRAQMLHAGAGDARGRVRHRGKADQRADLDVIGPDTRRSPNAALRAVHDHRVGADAVDARPERDEEMGEILHMRFGRGIA